MTPAEGLRRIRSLQRVIGGAEIELLGSSTPAARAARRKLQVASVELLELYRLVESDAQVELPFESTGARRSGGLR